MTTSLRSIAAQMDPLADPRHPIGIRSLLNYHRFAQNDPPDKRGCKEIVRRHKTGQSKLIRFLTYNTYLLEARLTLPDPFGDITLTGKPERSQRASELGQRIAKENYDFVSLYEVMQSEQKSEILAGLGGETPAHEFIGSNHSLFTISRSYPIVRSANMKFEKRGKTYRIKPLLLPGFDFSLDSDYYANKGVLLTEIDTGLCTKGGVKISVEIYSVHLMWGGGLENFEDTANVVFPFGDHISGSTPEERFSIQMMQIDELISFYRTHHRDENVVVLCGDFNIDGSDQVKFRELKNRLGFIRLKDAWAEGPYNNHPSSGQTGRNDDGLGVRETDFTNVCRTVQGPAGADYCDETFATKSPSESSGRLDYIFIEEPSDQHLANLDFSRVRRRQFKRQPTPEQQFLSDHLGLETTLIVSPRL
jgi:exonuclease III